MNPRLGSLRPYPFERLRSLLDGATPPAGLKNIPLSIGEPKHAPPPFIAEALTAALSSLGSYPLALGLPELRAVIATWLERRFDLAHGSVRPDDMVLPVNGTREGLFAFVQAAVDETRARAAVLMPNPFYQIYEGAALLAGAEPVYLDCDPAAGYLPDLDAVDAATWDRCQVLFLCTPGNPTGAVMPEAYLRRALELASRHDFVVASDECYSEIYLDEARPPPACCRSRRPRATGHSSAASCSTVSRSARASLGCAPDSSLAIRRCSADFVSIAPTMDARSRCTRRWPAFPPGRTRRTSARTVGSTVRSSQPSCRCCARCSTSRRRREPSTCGPSVGDDEAFARGLFAEQHVTVVPGTYLARETARGNPGRGRVRISLVASVEDCVEAARRIVAFVKTTALARAPARHAGSSGSWRWVPANAVNPSLGAPAATSCRGRLPEPIARPRSASWLRLRLRALLAHLPALRLVPLQRPRPRCALARSWLGGASISYPVARKRHSRR